MLRYLPLAVGILGSGLLVLNRLTTPILTPNQSRSDVLGVILCTVLVLVSLLWQQVQPKLPDAVALVGEEQFELAETLPQHVKAELAWASRLLLTNTVTKSLVIWWDDRVLLRRGILPETLEFTIGAIVKRAMEKQKPVYLVQLSLYPGRVEFGYLPENTQGVIVQPMGDRGVMVLGANAPRSYTQQDERWIEAIADKLTYSLQHVDP